MNSLHSDRFVLLDRTSQLSFEEDYAFACFVSWPFSTLTRDPAVCRHSPTKHSFIHHARQPC
jgi:hypothetical protein